MNKRYQVFLSSTYEDLKEERAKVIQALWELDCIPYGMEVFPATSTTSWEWIKKAIGESDYFILIVAGKNGTIEKESRISYTHKEYLYALSIGVPIISFIFGEENQLPAYKTEQNLSARKKLDDFKTLVKKNQCKFYSSPDDLKAQVATSMQHLIKSEPREGWVRAGVIESMQNRLAGNKNIKSRGTASGKTKTNSLAIGEQTYALEFLVVYKVVGKEYFFRDGMDSVTLTMSLSWNEIFYNVGYYFTNNDNKLRNTKSYFSELSPLRFSPHFDTKVEPLLQHEKVTGMEIKFSYDVVRNIMLKLIEQSCITLGYETWKMTTRGMKIYAGLQETYEN